MPDDEVSHNLTEYLNAYRATVLGLNCHPTLDPNPHNLPGAVTFYLMPLKTHMCMIR